MKHEKLIIEVLNDMAAAALNPEDFERWEKVKAVLLARSDNSMHELANQSLESLKGYNGRDFKAVGDDIVPLHGRGTIGYFQMGQMMPPIPAFIHARHQYSGGWKYDLNIAVLMDDGYHVTRLYNIEEKWVRKQP